jgi:hypothetical protein
MSEPIKCRRCSECPNSRHHWMECCEETETAEGTVIFDRICKHCELLGTACGDCENLDASIDITCIQCQGYGVIESCMYGRDDEDDDEECLLSADQTAIDDSDLEVDEDYEDCGRY